MADWLIFSYPVGIKTAHKTWEIREYQKIKKENIPAQQYFLSVTL
jgi:hypothetical protein